MLLSLFIGSNPTGADNGQGMPQTFRGSRKNRQDSAAGNPGRQQMSLGVVGSGFQRQGRMRFKDIYVRDLSQR